MDSLLLVYASFPDLHRDMNFISRLRPVLLTQVLAFVLQCGPRSMMPGVKTSKDDITSHTASAEMNAWLLEILL